MAISDYGELQTAVGRWLQRTDLGTLIPDFIANAEAEFSRTLRLTGQLTRADLTVSSRWTSLTTLTAPIAEIRSISVTDGGVRSSVEYLTPNQTQGIYETGTPMFYSRHGNELEILPEPSASYTLELLYWRTIPALATSSTSWLLSLAPDLYLYRAVMEGAQYIHAPELLMRVEPAYQRALAQLQADDSRRQFGGSALQQRVA